MSSFRCGRVALPSRETIDELSQLRDTAQELLGAFPVLFRLGCSFAGGAESLQCKLHVAFELVDEATPVVDLLAHSLFQSILVFHHGLFQRRGYPPLLVEVL